MCELPHDLAESQRLYSEFRPLSARPISPVEDILRSGSIVSQSSNPKKSLNQTFIIAFECGLKALWKPHYEKETSNYRSEVLAYEIDRKFGFNLVPPTVARIIDDRVGSVQLFIEGLKNDQFHLNERQPGMINGNRNAPPVGHLLQSDFDKQCFFDYLIHNRDRKHASKWFVSEGRLVSIDNGISFAVCPDVLGPLKGFSYTFEGLDSFLRQESTILERLRESISDLNFHAELTQYLGRSDAFAFLNRVEFILSYYDLFIKVS